MISTVNGIIWEADLHRDILTYVSDSSERVLGYSALEWLSTPMFWEQHLHPDDRAQAIAQYQLSTAARQSYESTYRMIDSRGEVVWLHEVVSTIAKKGHAALVRGVMVDITTLKRAELEVEATSKRLAESERRLATILDTAAIGIVTVDELMRIISFNREAERIFGHSAETMVGTTLDRLVPTAQVYRHQAHMRFVLELDPSRPFTAARARNEGFAWLRAQHPELGDVQFVDGDSELEPSFVPKALAHLDTHPRAVAVCGRIRERHPEASVYTRLCDIEWQAPIGLTRSCGGTLLVRARAFEDVKGFASELIAGEEPDLCARWAKDGAQVWRIDAVMAIHDADITSFRQWWLRSMRSGHAASQALSRKHLRDEHHLREVVSNVVWALPPVWPLWPVLWYDRDSSRFE